MRGDNRLSSSTGPSIIGVDLTVIGDLKSKGEIQIDGAVEGNVFAESILVTQGGRALGELRAQSVTVHGRVKGRIQAATTHLHPTSAMEGDISYERITIDEGAQFTGKMTQEMAGDQQPDASPASKSGAVSPASIQVVEVPVAKKA